MLHRDRQHHGLLWCSLVFKPDRQSSGGKGRNSGDQDRDHHPWRGLFLSCHRHLLDCWKLVLQLQTAEATGMTKMTRLNWFRHQIPSLIDHNPLLRQKDKYHIIRHSRIPKYQSRWCWKHCKNCECCPVSFFIVRSLWLYCNVLRFSFVRNVNNFTTTFRVAAIWGCSLNVMMMIVMAVLGVGVLFVCWLWWCLLCFLSNVFCMHRQRSAVEGKPWKRAGVHFSCDSDQRLLASAAAAVLISRTMHSGSRQCIVDTGRHNPWSALICIAVHWWFKQNWDNTWWWKRTQMW